MWGRRRARGLSFVEAQSQEGALAVGRGEKRGEGKVRMGLTGLMPCGQAGLALARALFGMEQYLQLSTWCGFP